ncbi:hypothetical protein T03_14029 [Trichinella britovi]|uniref:Uncharacterized protein n=1 Tax=Trichinella britovi TaxID=45882 RepID=A0A0V1CVY3_TRIBR|nr:hypothetical protein T03_14029 [Trichinella britovi]
MRLRKSKLQDPQSSLVVLLCQQKQTKQEIYDTVDRAVRDYQTSLRGKLSHPEYQKPKTNPAGPCQSLKAISAAYDKNKTKIRNKFDVNGNPSPSPGYTAHDWCGLKKTMDGIVRQHQQW